jgi:glutathione-specific gamma-glutamylcyclotransferase
MRIKNKKMWVFGYGSLAWDSWSGQFGCLRCLTAELLGFRRTFDKGSVKNWGSKNNPCPTLNLAVDPSRTCKGVAFEFFEEKRNEVTAYLKKREGNGFELKPVEIRLESGDRVSAIVPIYSGKNLISVRSSAELTAMVRGAQGIDGKCIDYARNIAMKLAELGIDDPEVEDFWRAVK